MNTKIFRQEAIDRLSSPEQLDRLFTLVRIKAWIPLLALAVLSAGVVVWSIFGRIPETIDGAGVLVNPGRVRGLQSSYGGQIIELYVRSGQIVSKNQELAKVNQPDLKQQLQQGRVKLGELERVDKLQKGLEAKRLEQEAELQTAQEKLLNESIQEITEFTKQMVAHNDAQAKDQRAILLRNKEELLNLNKVVKTMLENVRQLSASKVVTTSTLVSAEAQLIDSSTQLAQIDIRIGELGMKEMENKQFRSQQYNKMSDLRIQTKQLLLRQTQLIYEIAQASANREAMLQEQRDRIQQLERMLEEQGIIRSPFAGRILEMAVQNGQLVAPGARLGAIELAESEAQKAEYGSLRVIAYFPLHSGKKLKDGMAVRVSPSTIQRERFGSMIGNVKRVSAFPVTEEAAATVIGNVEIVRALVQPGGMIEVEIDLEQDENSFSGYRWTSAGPALKLAAGTTASVRVITEERAPITYVLPLLKSWTSDGA